MQKRIHANGQQFILATTKMMDNSNIYSITHLGHDIDAVRSGRRSWTIWIDGNLIIGKPESTRGVAFEVAMDQVTSDSWSACTVSTKRNPRPNGRPNTTTLGAIHSL